MEQKGKRNTLNGEQRICYYKCMTEPIHLHSERAKFNPQTLFLLVPSILFIVVLGFSYRIFRHPASLSDVRQAVQALDPVKTPTPMRTATVGDHTLSVEIADTDVLRRQGLSGRTELPKGTGMLFIFNQEDIKPPFWMKDMVIAIDIVWINDGVVTQIHENIAPPASGAKDSDLKLYIPNTPIDYVLELPAGYTKEVGIAVGDTFSLSQ